MVKSLNILVLFLSWNIFVLISCKEALKEESFFQLNDSSSFISFYKIENNYLKLITTANGNNTLQLRNEKEAKVEIQRLKIQGNLVIENIHKSTIDLKAYATVNVNSEKSWIEDYNKTPDFIGKYEIKFKIDSINSASKEDAIIVDSIDYCPISFSLDLYKNNTKICNVEIEHLIFTKDEVIYRSINNREQIFKNIKFNSNKSILEKIADVFK